MKEVLIIIPAFNEEASIGTLLEQLNDEKVRSLADVLVVNDASNDKTIHVAKEYGVTTVSHVFNLGYGSALQLGYKYAVRQGYEYVIQLDADGQHDATNIFTIYEALKRKDANSNRPPDIVIGSRFLEGSASFSLSGMKRFAMGFFRLIIRFATRQRILDPTSGLQGLNRRAFFYYSIFQNFNYSFPDANMIIQMLLLGFKVTEVPAVMHERKTGESMHSGILKPFVYMLIMPLSIIGVYLRIKLGIQKPVVFEPYPDAKGDKQGSGGLWVC